MDDRFVAERYRNRSVGLTLDTQALSRYGDVINLSIGDTDFTTDTRIIDGARTDACAGYTHYGDPKGDPELIEAVCRAWQEDQGEAIPSDQVLVTASSCLGMALTMMAILNPGDEVLIFSPYFTMYREQVELAGGRAVIVPTYAHEGYAIREDRIRAAITPRTRAMIFNNPNNPTGMAYGEDTLALLASIAQEYDLVVAADDIYTFYFFEGSYRPIRCLPGMAQRTVTLNSFSKNYLMTGWRVGYVIAPPAIIQTMNAINGALCYSTPSVSQRAALHALSLRQELRQTYGQLYRQRVSYSAQRIQEIPYLDLCVPRGTFYLFPSVQKTGLSSAEFCARLLEEAHILVTPGSVFGAEGEGHFRIACTVGQEVLREAFDRMERLKF